MDSKKIYNNIQGRIALDNFKIERIHIKKTRKRALISLSILIFFACIFMKNTQKKYNKKTS